MLKTENQHGAGTWIELLQLRPHPEGGWYRESYRSDMQLHPGGYPGPRPAATGIYYLLQYPDFSAFHRLRSDETWHFYAGGPVLIYELATSGLKKTRLGCNPYIDCIPQYTVQGNTWFAAEPEDRGSYALMGCTVAPGFDFKDFELAERTSLRAAYQAYRPLIDRLCAYRAEPL